MASQPLPFEGVERIPGLVGVEDHNGEIAFWHLKGNCPVIIVAPHAGSAATTPSDAKGFGRRVKDPMSNKDPRVTNDLRTLDISLGLVRTLCAMGFVPHAFLNRVDRGYVDLNRPWPNQAMWESGGREYRPGDEDKSLAELPRAEEFRQFKSSYYDRFHAEIRATTTALTPTPPRGWLFDVHGRGNTDDLVVFTGYGYYARRDFVYDNGNASLHSHLKRQELPVRVHPPLPDPKTEDKADVGGTSNLISGGRYGARSFTPGRDPIPFPGGVVTPSAGDRVHGVQFEGLGSLRPRTGQPELVEGVGISLAYAIAGFLQDNGILTRTQRPLPGHGAVSWSSAMM
nr:N-formylglutamate amidohydrolase [[Micrococcus luteus] ATCC 49442]